MGRICTVFTKTGDDLKQVIVNYALRGTYQFKVEREKFKKKCSSTTYKIIFG